MKHLELGLACGFLFTILFFTNHWLGFAIVQFIKLNFSWIMIVFIVSFVLFSIFSLLIDRFYANQQQFYWFVVFGIVTGGVTSSILVLANALPVDGVLAMMNVFIVCGVMLTYSIRYRHLL